MNAKRRSNVLLRCLAFVLRPMIVAALRPELELLADLGRRAHGDPELDGRTLREQVEILRRRAGRPS